MSFRTCTKALARLATCLVLGGLTALAGAQQAPQKDTDKKPADRIEKKTYEFKEAGKEMEYALFVPSGYDKAKKAPLIVALHGLGGNPQQMIRSRGLTEQAEKGGYIVVAPMGYNSSGWYGARGPGGGSGGPGGFGTPPGTVLSPRVQDNLKLTDEQKKKIGELQKEVDASIQKILTEEQNKQLKGLRDNAGRGPGSGLGGGQDAPNNLGELSEKDVMNVLELVRKEFTIDDKRIYLIGHSMGGGGTWHLGTKYPDVWAGLAPIAPAAFGQPTGLDKIKNVPVIVVQGDKDTLVRPEGTRRWVDRMKELNMTYEYVEIPGGGHGDVVTTGMPKIFEFFEKQKKEDKGK
ncbi:MAG TPA: alpha/beta hydrolase [Gemmataceae bacterium]|nr:alpha/beta hydrolase [Gemmataceae bacterium]